MLEAGKSLVKKGDKVFCAYEELLRLHCKNEGKIIHSLRFMITNIDSTL